MFERMLHDDDEMLPVYHDFDKLSPHTLLNYMQCPTLFYLRKVSENKEAIAKASKWDQNLPAAVGSAFDCFVRDFLNKELNLGIKDSLEELLRETVTKHFDSAVEMGEKLFLYYSESALPYLLEQGVKHIDYRPTRQLGSALCHGYIDCVTNAGIVDWKVKGACASSKSPTAGWLRKWEFDSVGGYVLNKNPHKRVNDNFEDINFKWALQATFYSFLLGHEPGDPLLVGFDEISLRNVDRPEKLTPETAKITQIRSSISPQFQKTLFWAIQEVWARAKSGRFPKARPSNFRCHPYKQSCIAAKFCEAYQVGFGDPDFAGLCM